MMTNQPTIAYGRSPDFSYGYSPSPLRQRHAKYVNPQYPQHAQGAPRPVMAEDTLKSAEVQIERKAFVVTLKENPRGRFLRITEGVNGRRETIIIPSTGLIEFQKIIEEMVRASTAIPEKSQPPAEANPA